MERERESARASERETERKETKRKRESGRATFRGGGVPWGSEARGAEHGRLRGGLGARRQGEREQQRGSRRATPPKGCRRTRRAPLHSCMPPHRQHSEVGSTERQHIGDRKRERKPVDSSSPLPRVHERVAFRLQRRPAPDNPTQPSQEALYVSTTHATWHESP
eukprot:3304286-Rhodomonas_salina.1